MRNTAGTHYIWIEANNIAGARNVCKQAALNRTNSEMWHGEDNTDSSVCFKPCVHAIRHLLSSILWDGFAWLVFRCVKCWQFSASSNTNVGLIG